MASTSWVTAMSRRAVSQADATVRRARGQPAREADADFLDALGNGLPPCSGVALGFDRVVMIAAGARHIDDVIAFPIERA